MTKDDGRPVVDWAERPAPTSSGLRQVRLANLELVLRDLRRHGPASRAQIAARLGVTRPTLTRVAGELLELRLVREAGYEARGPGRPGTILELDGGHVFAVGAEINVDAITVIVHDLSGRERARRRRVLDARDIGPEASVRSLASLCADVVAESAGDHDGTPTVAGFVTALPGIVTLDGSLLVNAPNLGWRNVPVAVLLREALGFERAAVSIGNDANFAALAEFWRGEHAGRRHLVYVTGEVGVGGGVVADGELLLGSGGRAAELGHMVVDPSGPACSCGRHGCWEAYVGLDAFLRATGLPASGRRPEATVQQVVALLRRGDARVLRAVEELASWIGIGVANVVNLYDPELVILGGYFTHLASWILPAAHQVLEGCPIVTDRPAAELLVASKLGFRAAALGAALHAAEAVFSNPTLFGES